MRELSPREVPDASPERQLRWERRARQLHADVAARASAEPTERGVLATALHAVYAHTVWPLAHCYVLEADGLLHSARLWQGADGRRFGAFVSLTESLPFAAGAGLPGRVLALGRPAWITDVAGDVNFPRAAPYLDAGLGAAFAFAVLAGGQVLAVLEFFADHAQPPDEALLDVLGAIGHLVGQLVARRRAERALAVSEARFRAVADSAPDAVVAVDVEGRVTFWSRAAERMFGWSADQQLGQPLDVIIPPELRAAHHAGMARVRETGVSRMAGRAVEIRAVRADGTTLPVELTLGMGEEPDGRLFTAVIRDITARVEARERLRAQSDELLAQHQALQRSHAELVDAQQLMERIFSAYAEILPGTILDGRYRLEEAIGSGGHGIVYRSVHLALGREVAVKLFRPASGRVTAEQVRRFQREGQARCRVAHPNVVAVLDAGVSADGLPFLAMDLLRGETLAAVLRREGTLGLREALRLAAALSDGLAAMHDAGLVHRDIKPENVFVHREGAVVIPKLLDFGIVRLLEDDAEEHRLTRTGSVIGTPAYIAPERLGGDPGGCPADVFSMGVLVYRAVSGRSPSPERGGPLWAARPAHAFTPLTDLDPVVPAALDLTLRQVLDPDPSGRLTARSLAHALRRLAEGAPDRRLSPPPAPAPADETVAFETPTTDLARPR